VLSDAERREFEELGIVRLPGAVEPRVVAELRERTVAFVAERRLVPEATGAGFAVKPSLLARVTKGRTFASVWGARVRGVLDDVLGVGAWQTPDDAGQLLFMTWPTPAARWELPHKMWHLDYPAPGALRGIPGAQLFLCVDRIEPRGGATLVAAGLPRLIDAIRRREGREWSGRSADVRKALRAELPWFRALCSLRSGEDRIARFMTGATAVEGGSLQVVELTGEAGDVHLMHPWMVHGLSTNCGSRPRMALTARFYVHASSSASPAGPAIAPP
jgi:hypothetical protein